jgi:hypothetical protein
MDLAVNCKSDLNENLVKDFKILDLFFLKEQFLPLLPLLFFIIIYFSFNFSYFLYLLAFLQISTHLLQLIFSPYKFNQIFKNHFLIYLHKI